MVLEGKRWVIVGGTGGLGFSAARAGVGAGARVIVVGRNPAKAAQAVDALGPNALAVIGDASEPSTADAAVEKARQTWGGVDGVYHVAGGSGRRFGDGPLHQITDEGWSRTMHLNLDAAFFSARAAVRHWVSSGGSGSFLFCGSALGAHPSPGHFATHAYAAAKAALYGWTRSLAAYYAPQGIRFNLVAPGLVATPMSQRAQEDAAIQDFIRRKQPLDGGRIGRPEDLDAAVVWLLSDASRFVTGQTVAVDGGWGVTEAGRG